MPVAPTVPILFEALPPSEDATPTGRQDHLAALEPLRTRGLAGINVPEILDGHYRTVDPVGFAGVLQRRLGVPASVNRVTVHHDVAALHQWAHEARTLHGINNFVLVGGDRGVRRHAGTEVGPALAALGPSAKQHGGALGVVTIPTRRRADLDEPERLLRKRQLGADFAISQILCEPGSATALLRDLEAQDPDGNPGFTVYWSLAPVARKRDLEFLDWLGVHVPRATRLDLLGQADEAACLRRSHDLNQSWARAILLAAESTAPGGIRVGFCIEHVMQSNVGAAIDLLDRVSAIAGEFRQPATQILA